MDGYRLIFSVFCFLALNPCAQAQASFGCKTAQPSFQKQIDQLNSINKAYCQVSEQFDEEERSISKGARQAMMMLYGSCGVLKLPVANSREVLPQAAIPKNLIRAKSGIRNIKPPVSAVADAHFYLQNTRAESSEPECSSPAKLFSLPHPSCSDISCLVLQNPPLYQYGGKAQDLSLYHLAKYKTESNTLGVDCSGFISQSLLIQGLSFYPKGSPNKNRLKQSFGTAELHGLGQGGDCFLRPDLRSPFKSGDLLVGPHHVVAIDTVGSDPFGIDENLKKDLKLELERVYRSDQHGLRETAYQDLRSLLSDPTVAIREDEVASAASLICNDWTADASKFKITIIHSSPDSGQLGVQREKMVPALGSQESSSVWVTALQERARTMCEDRVFEAIASKSQSKISPLRLHQTSATSVVMLRHDSERSECRVPKADMPQIPGLDCVQCCSTEASYENLVPQGSKIYANHYHRVPGRSAK